MIAAWIAKDDPAVEEAAEQASATDTSTWRLARVEACNFGGLTTFGGPVFDFWVDGTNWGILGQNGSGKTSLTDSRCRHSSAFLSTPEFEREVLVTHANVKQRHPE